MNKADFLGSSFSLFDNLLEGCQVIGFDWSYIYLNKTAEIHNRRPNSELLGKNYISEWPGIEYTNVFRVLKHCLENRIPEKIENEFTYPDGSKKWFLLSIQPMPMGILILSIDLTDKKQSERSLIESERKFKSVFESSNIAKSITLPTGEINVNKAFCNMLGYSMEELTNKKWSDITPPEEIDMLNNEVDMLISGVKQSTRFRKRYIHKNGSYVWTDVSVALVLNDAGKPLYFLTTVVDITEQKQAEIVINKLNEELEERESSWLLSVNDNGVGFDMKYYKKIFVIFQRLHKDEEFPGTGIGLAMVSKAMQKMNGKTWAESRPDVGSTFYLEMPKTI
jgi:PAS domain S-box-containing protein